MLDPTVGHDQPMLDLDQILMACRLLQDTVDERQVIGVGSGLEQRKRGRQEGRVFEDA
ncbi:hypothetical protein D3C79_1066820 [compost metagenome]